MPAELLREIIPLTTNDCFTIFSRKKKGFDFPLHYHDEFELNFIMDAKKVVGVGNIYASESLFRAGIHPRTKAGRISLERYAKLVAEIKATLKAAIRAGGSSLRDFVHSDGSSGYAQQSHFVYGREGKLCRKCSAPIRRVVMGQRATFYCPVCQK